MPSPLRPQPPDEGDADLDDDESGLSPDLASAILTNAQMAQGRLAANLNDPSTQPGQEVALLSNRPVVWSSRMLLRQIYRWSRAANAWRKLARAQRVLLDDSIGMQHVPSQAKREQNIARDITQVQAELARVNAPLEAIDFQLSNIASVDAANAAGQLNGSAPWEGQTAQAQLLRDLTMLARDAMHRAALWRLMQVPEMAPVLDDTVSIDRALTGSDMADDDDPTAPPRNSGGSSGDAGGSGTDAALDAYFQAVSAAVSQEKSR